MGGRQHPRCYNHLVPAPVQPTGHLMNPLGLSVMRKRRPNFLSRRHFNPRMICFTTLGKCYVNTVDETRKFRALTLLFNVFSMFCESICVVCPGQVPPSVSHRGVLTVSSDGYLVQILKSTTSSNSFVYRIRIRKRPLVALQTAQPNS